jgi:hypothetical protein|tara:strand:+ start:3967 stop:4155 length:189 start_codon:yes stop_codon:yes gene_type:complete
MTDKNIERDIIDSKMLDEIKTAKQALDLQEKIDNLIAKLEKLGFEFMWYNRISGIRRKRKNV